ncbi:hypothetical protein NQ318_017256 [Aromia moschata]|uniref:Uncharacterized protein n=1 Tax=Aromia moschata TaxID=1265417 RepID=A0AAV8YKL2_9CUCU|nr:hypothetical protein NQ318_017256 [Aromia moschata]
MFETTEVENIVTVHKRDQHFGPSIRILNKCSVKEAGNPHVQSATWCPPLQQHSTTRRSCWKFRKKNIAQLESKFPYRNITDQNFELEIDTRLRRIEKSQIDEIAENLDKFIERESFERDYFASIAKGKLFTQAAQTETRSSVGSSSLSNSGTSDIQNIKLPYRGTFDSLIHKNAAVIDIQKFHCLRASLSGSALQIIVSLEFSSENYVIAWSLICDRFNHVRVLKQNHVKALFNLDRLTEESSVLFRKIIDKITKHLRTLKMLKEPTESWDTLIIHLVTTKLDATTAREWEQKKSVYEHPSFQNPKGFSKGSRLSFRGPGARENE